MKVTAGRRDGEGIHFDSGASKYYPLVNASEVTTIWRYTNVYIIIIIIIIINVT